MTELQCLYEHIIEINNSVSVWMDAIDRAFAHRWNINSIEPGTFCEKLQEASWIAHSAAGDGPTGDAFAVIELASWIYLQAHDHDRLQIRTMFAESRSVLQQIYSYIGSQLSALSVDGSEERLVLALLAASIEDRQTDARDLHLLLIDLRKAAQAHNMDADTHFSNVASLSSATPPRNGRGVSTQEFLRSFITPGWPMLC
jgi:hypothetical protein